MADKNQLLKFILNYLGSRLIYIINVPKLDNNITKKKLKLLEINIFYKEGEGRLPLVITFLQDYPTGKKYIYLFMDYVKFSKIHTTSL